MDKKKQILIVDDEPEVLSALEKRITSWGYMAIKASNGRDAISLTREKKPDLIILDVDMPEMDGGEVASELKNSTETSAIPIIFLTCLVTKKERIGGSKEVGQKVFIAKPYNPDDLYQEIKKHFNSDITYIS